MQIQIDWDSIPHKSENNPHSEAILFDQYDKLNKQCKIVYNELRAGKRLTVRDAMLFLGIGDLRRRVKDLRDKGIDVQSEMIGNGFKIYFL